MRPEDISFEEYTRWTKSKRLRVMRKLAITYLMDRDNLTLEEAKSVYNGYSKQRRLKLRLQRQKHLLRQFDY